jgi:hypothetical protein
MPVSLSGARVAGLRSCCYITAMNPLTTLIENRRLELGLRKLDVVVRAGYTNIGKGCRRYDELLGGDLHTTRGLIGRLPAALDIPAETVTEAVAETKRQYWSRVDAEYRAAFKPQGFIVTEHTVPTSITMAAFTGADRHLWVNFEPSSAPLSYLAQTLKAVRLRSPIQWFGHATGVIVNYSPDHAIRFDLDGTPLEVLSGAHRGGTLSVSIRGGPAIDSKVIAAILFGH